LHPASRAKIAFRHALHRAGFDLVRALPPEDLLRRRIALLRRQRVDLVFDVGANAGQYGSTMRALGYDGRIVSFEPSSEAFGLLVATARGDDRWTAVHCALAETGGRVTLHVAGNSQSSSLLPMLPAHVAAAPDSAYLGDEVVEASTLAAEIDRHVGPDDRLFVKIDTQGSELRVLEGAGDRLTRVLGLQVELSLVPLYDGQPLIEEVVATLRRLGYVPAAIEPDFFDPVTGALLQADAVFLRP